MAAGIVHVIAEALDRVDDPARDGVADSMIFQTVLGAHSSEWSSSLRTSPEMRQVMMRAAKWSRDDGLGSGVEGAAVAATHQLFDLAGNDVEKRAVLVEIIDVQDLGAWTAMWLLVPILDEHTKQGLRTQLTVEDFNDYARMILGHVGDQPSLEIARQILASLAEDGVVSGWLVNTLRDLVWEIEVQSSPASLIDAFQSTDDRVLFRRTWILQRAMERGVDKSRMKQAIIDWAQTVPPVTVSLIKQVAMDEGILAESDLPEVPPAGTMLNGCPVGYVPQKGRRQVSVTDRRPKQQPWQPNNANYDALNAWFAGQDWAHIPDDEGLRLIRRKACELDLLSPDLCETYANP